MFEITNQGINGMFIKYQMALFLGIFVATMLVQFVVQFFDSVADIYGEPVNETPPYRWDNRYDYFSCISVRYDGICSWIRYQ